MRLFLHIVAILILGLFIASFFIGLKTDPSYIDIIRSPYGLFTYFIVTTLTVFIPSLVTLPIVTTATLIWGPWLAGSIAVVGWTIGGLIEYAAAYFAMNKLVRWGNGQAIEEKIIRVKRSVKFWQLIIARAFVPAFIFGLVKTKLYDFTWASIFAYVPLAVVGVTSGEFILKPYLDQIQPLLVGAALVLLIFTLDFLFTKKGVHHKEKI